MATLGLNIPGPIEEADVVRNNLGNDGGNNEDTKTPTGTAKRTDSVLDDSEVPLYPDCLKYSIISFLLRFYHLKTLYGWSAKSFMMLLELLIDALPNGTKLLGPYSRPRRL